MYNVETLPFARARGCIQLGCGQFVFDYWSGLRRGRRVPDRRDLEPSDMVPALGELILLETFAGSVSFRLGGSRFTAHLGRETRGTSAATIWRGADRGRFEALIRTLCDMPGGAILHADLMTPDREPTPYEFVLLPMTFRGSDISRFLGMGAPLRNDYWLGSEMPIGFEMRRITLFDLASKADGIDHHVISAPIQPVRIRKHLALYEGGFGR